MSVRPQAIEQFRHREQDENQYSEILVPVQPVFTYLVHGLRDVTARGGSRNIVFAWSAPVLGITGAGQSITRSMHELLGSIKTEVFVNSVVYSCLCLQCHKVCQTVWPVSYLWKC